MFTHALKSLNEIDNAVSSKTIEGDYTKMIKIL